MQKYLVANWKMNCNAAEAKELVHGIIKGIENCKLKIENLNIVLCPPFTALQSVSLIIHSSDYPFIQLGAQNCHFMPCGAFTGEISTKMLKDFCQYVILGHSERRKYFNEDDKLISKKVRVALDNNLTPIICVGEFKKGEKSHLILSQVKNTLSEVRNEDLDKVIFAYEPVWAISTTADREDCEPSYAAKIIREIKETTYNKSPVLYGGSVDASNISGFVAYDIIDGVLVGGASLKAKEFIKIIEKVGANAK